MANFILGTRKYVEDDQVHYWLLITAKAAVRDENEGEEKVNYSRLSFAQVYIQLINSFYWKIFIMVTVTLNLYSFIGYFWLDPKTLDSVLIVIIVFMHMNCFFYWIDFVGATIEKVVIGKGPDRRQSRHIVCLILDAVSLIPLSTLYLICVRDIDTELLWKLRGITAIRFYRVPRFFSQLSSSDRNHWTALIIAYASYLVLFIIFFANMFVYSVDEYSPVTIQDWNESAISRMVVSLYYAVVMTFNVGYGDMEPMSYGQMLLNVVAMSIGTAASTGIFSGILGIAFTNKAVRREHYRYEYEATRNTLKERRIDRKVMHDILENMDTLWKWKKGYKGPPPVHILPLSLQREIYFDVNFAHLHRSLIFSMQPRSFLRSVSMFMKNVTYLPGDIIMEPTGVSDVMICVASGVIEVLSEENDESVLFSLTTGTIIGEATLFIPLPIRCIIRASTYVELQVLMKVHFARLALTYPDTFRSMRSEIFFRLQFKEDVSPYSLMHRTSINSDLKRRRETKKFLSNLKNINQQESPQDRFFSQKTAILGLYTLSENIPRVKTLPINLIRARPWILRPDTTLTKFWKLITIIVIIFVAVCYPVMTGFIRHIDPWMYVVLVASRAFYVVDVYLQCTTAIERKDHFTYITSIKEIIGHRLKTIGFYLDVLAMYYLGIYAHLVWPENVDYAYLLLSLNALLKTWQVLSYMKKLEDDLKNNLLMIVTIKYALCICFIITWGAVLLYVEARPGESYLENRWFYNMEMAEIQDKQSVPRSVSPSAVTFYFATVTTLALGYGDIVAKTIVDCVVVSTCIVAGFILIISCVAESAAAIKHLARIRTNYQEELSAVDMFMVEHEIPQGYRTRVRNYMRLQWDYDKGYSLKQISITQTLPGLQRRIIMMELSKTFLCVSLFREAEPDFLKLLARLCKVRVLPPHEWITMKGSLIREMYIIENGFCEVTRETEDETEKRIIGSLSPIGVLEMILGEEQRLQVETLTHVRMVSLTYSSYLQAVTKYPGVKMEIDDAMRGYGYDDEDEVLGFGNPEETETNSEMNLKIQKQLTSKAFINVYKYHKTIGSSYWVPYTAWGKFRIFQFFILPIAIPPDSHSLKIWMSIRIIRALIIGVLAPIQFSLLPDKHQFMSIIIALQVVSAVDMYFMFHVAYYDQRGLLMFHPSKTATQYLKGSFIVDLIIIFPYYWFLNYLYPEARGYRKFFIKTSGLIMTFQLYKFFQAFRYLENDILRKTDVIKILKLLPFVAMVINLITGFILILQCYKVSTTNVSELQGSTRLANELVDNLRLFCRDDTNGTHITEATMYKMYLITIYWITTTITVCGFGDIWAHNETTMIFVILILTLGIFFFSYVFSSITSSMVTTNILISKSRKRVLKMSKFMKKKNVNPALHERLVLHYEYNWKRTEGGSPQKIFSYVHGGLREGIIRSMYEAILSQNPVFKDLEKTIVSIIGKYSEELYFLQGETITKYKDIQEHIYLIYRGEVHVLNHQNQFVASMGSGGVFGNVSNKTFSLSSQTVVASENVDLVRMDRKAFFSELQSIPKTKDLMASLTSTKEDYILPYKRADSFSGTRGQPMKLNLFRLRTVPMERRGTMSTHLYHISGFSFRNSIFFLRFKPYQTFVILPGTTLNNVIDILIFGMAYLSMSLTIYMFAFQDFSLHILITLYILDVMFLVEIYLQFHMSYSDKFGDCIVNTKAIRKRYLKSTKLFYDIGCNVPLELFCFAASRDWWMKLLSILRLNRTLRLHYVFRYYYKKKKELMTNKIYLEVGWILVIISLLTHTLACIWFVAVSPLGYFQEPTWVTDMDLLGKRAWEYYIYSVFHIVTITTTTGLQKLRIYSIPEVVLTMIFMITCRYVVVLLSGLMAATINADSLTLFVFQQRIIELKYNFSRQNLSAYQLDKMWSYLTTLWVREHGRQMPKFISKAPYTLKCEVMMAMFGKHLSQSYVFSLTDLPFLRQLASHLKRFVYFPGNYIVQQGDIDYTMYFIHKGEVSVLTIHPELIETIHFTLTENDSFGVTQGLIIGKAHDFSYRAETNVEILSLTLSDWQHLLKYFPEEGKKINQKMEAVSELLV